VWAVDCAKNETTMSEIFMERLTGSAKQKIKGWLVMFRPAPAAVLVGVSYYVGAKIGFALTLGPHPVSTLWPSNSILLAALVLAPWRRWWLYLLAVLPAHFLIELQSGVPVLMTLCWFISNSSEAIIGALCLRYLNDRPLRFDSIRQVASLLFAALLASFLSSFLDAGFVVLNRWGSGSYWQVWQMRFFSNVLAELIIVPLIIMWSTDRFSNFRQASLWRWLEAVGLVLGLMTVSVTAFSWNYPGSNMPALLYAPLPILLWAAVRFNPKDVNICLALVTFLAIWSAIHQRGPFVAYSPEQSALSIQLFLILISMPLMFLAAVIQEVGRAQEKARQNEDRLTMALSAAQMGTWDWHIRDDETRWSAETKRMFGFSPSQPETTPEGFFALLHPADRSSVEQAINRSIRDGTPYEAEFRVPRRDGRVRWIRGKGKVVFDEQGKPLRLIGVNADITRQKNSEEQLRQSHRQVHALAGRLINAQEAERRRVAHELHDDLNQRVAALSITISRLKRKLPESPQAIVTHLNDLYDQTNDLGNNIRQLSHELHPSTLDHLGLAEALAAYVGKFEEETGIPTSFSARITREKIAPEISLCLYRIALEALRNIARHSEAKSSSVLLEEHEEVLTLKVIDTGVGFDVEAATGSSGLGLISVAERVNLLQGTFEIESTPTKGTQLTAKIPLKQKSPDEVNYESSHNSYS
jgi:PAS domain S-box-containing protein